MRRPNSAMHVVLFSPAIVLMIWAMVVSIDGWLGDEWMIFFLVVLGFAAAGAEGVRSYLRNTNRRRNGVKRNG